MIIQDFYIPQYDWHVRVYYAVTTYWTRKIINDLEAIGCSQSNIERAYANLSRGDLNTGLTYSNNGYTVMVISLTSTPAQFQNSYDHEKGHLCRHISQAYNINPYSEEEQYLAGYIGQKMFPVAQKFLCEHCREELYRSLAYKNNSRRF